MHGMTCTCTCNAYAHAHACACACARMLHSLQVVSSIKWNTNGSVLAVSGLFNVAGMFNAASTDEPGDVLHLELVTMVQFYSAHGQLLKTLTVRAGRWPQLHPSYTLSLSCAPQPQLRMGLSCTPHTRLHTPTPLTGAGHGHISAILTMTILPARCLARASRPCRGRAARSASPSLWTATSTWPTYGPRCACTRAATPSIHPVHSPTQPTHWPLWACTPSSQMVQVDLDSTSNDSPALAPIAEDNAEEVTIPPPVTSPLADILDKLLQPIRGRKGRRKVAPIAEEVPRSKEVTTPLADGPSAKAPMETSKPACRKQLGRRDTSCACVRTLLAFAVLALACSVVSRWCRWPSSPRTHCFMSLCVRPCCLPLRHRVCCRSSSRQVQPCTVSAGVARRRSKWRTWASR